MSHAKLINVLNVPLDSSLMREVAICSSLDSEDFSSIFLEREPSAKRDV